ncbi:hypothetical protein WICMUC_003786 [Wickerhamomyces mucosus]|uniref:Uncharacterized protein n=1 Tax=Wickerhamomyces mucosus TaxID=1378264 RepID=A0A9P8TCK5_9ASCO|nr:hypothetical protein WICMUC_003786 [Wickerhamomyces mucosus]
MSKELSNLSKKVKQFYDEIYTIKDTVHGYPIWEIFSVVPDKKIYPDYFQVITSPTSLNSIKKRYPYYSSANEFIRDLAQIIWNAKTYNQAGSDVYRYAELLDGFLTETVIPKFKKSGYEVGYPDLSPITAERAGTLIAYNLAPLPPTTQDSSLLITQPGTPVPEDYGNTTLNGDEGSEIDLNSRKNTKLTGGTKDQAHKRGRPPVIDKPFEQRIKNVLRTLKREKDRNSTLITFYFEKLPDSREFPEYYNVITDPMSLDEIRKKIKQRKYRDVKSFVDDIKKMLENAKYFNEQNSPIYAQAVDFEVLFNRSIEEEMRRPDSDFIPLDSLKIPLDQLELHGKLYKIGDWILINNPNDATKPIVSQLFRIWKTQDGQRWVNVCWYLRPEQTVHRVDRLFLENEVFKSGQYRDHTADEILGHCYVAYFTRYQRGDPANPYEGPLFICEYRYNDNDKNFNKIRTWKACLPDEVRDEEEHTIPLPHMRVFKKYESPLKHLLPANATIDMPIPEPTIGAANAPPLHGAVYLRDIDPQDDLGQYASSRICPKYIIRPNDPPPSENSPAIATPVATNPNRNTVSPNEQQQLHQQLQQLQRQQQQQQQQQQQAAMYHATPSFAPTTTASSFTLPLDLPTASAGLLRMDDAANSRRLGGIKPTSQGPLIWFRSPALNIPSRITPTVPLTSLNRIRKHRSTQLTDDNEDNDDDFEERPGNGIAGNVRLGHSAKYIAYKLQKIGKA